MARKKLPADVLEWFRKQGAKGGAIGGSKGGEAAAADRHLLFGGPDHLPHAPVRLPPRGRRLKFEFSRTLAILLGR
jgi:hypothetical protein